MKEREFPPILNVEEGYLRTAALVGWVQGLFPGGKDAAPVLVGGAAVELFTRGAYTTGDLDFVGEVTPSVQEKLIKAGFRKKGRHFIREDKEIYVEFPSRDLGEGETSAYLSIGGHRVLIISPEDLIVDRLAAWQHWRSLIDGANAFLLLRARGRSLDRGRLRERARKAGTGKALKMLLDFARRRKGMPVKLEALHAWASKGPR